jgi:hypothetical protein
VNYLALAAVAAALSACTGERSTEVTPSSAPLVAAPVLVSASNIQTAPSKKPVESSPPEMFVLGTVVIGFDKSALIRVGLQAPYTVRVGDSIGQEQVVAIEFDSIVLSKGDAKRRIVMSAPNRQDKPSLNTAVAPQSVDNPPQLPPGFTPLESSGKNASSPEDLSSNRAFEKFIRERTGPS